MTEREFDLTRRKVLGSIGAIGAASAGAGLGTSALFTDEESFENNTLTAGELDLKVDWEEHYSYPQLYDFGDPASGLDYGVSRTEPEDAANYVPLPDPDDPMVWVHADDLETYMANTSIEAFPDPDGDGQQEVEWDGTTYDPCVHGADLDDDLTPGEEGTATRTSNSDTVVDGEPQSLINLQDVKPGDFGEFTLSFHLCDNPGYVWLQASNFSESGGDNPDPEQVAEGDADNDPNLAENVETVWWYDDGDNVLSRGANKLYLSNHSSADGASLYEVTFDGGNANTAFLASPDFDASHIAAAPDGETVYAVDEFNPRLVAYDVSGGSLGSIQSIDLNGNGPLGDVVQATVATDGTLYLGSKSEDALFAVSDPGGSPTVTDRLDLEIDISGADNAFTSNGSFYLYTNSTHELHTVNLNDGDIGSSVTLETEEDLTGLAVLDSGAGDFVGSVSQGAELIVFDDGGAVQDRYDLSGDLTNHTYGDMTAGDLSEIIYRGTLDEAITELTGGELLNDGDCYQPGFSRYIGFAWWVPTNVGNEIQGDSVSFDFGFYTEQCRNNEDPDGPEVTEPT
jgi:predicted ribosomally synthesized peptide with SipW-like signal peptide